MVYVNDWMAHTIWQFSPQGELLKILEDPGEELCNQDGVAVSREGSVYVADSCHHSIKEFNTGGELISRWGIFGDDQGDFNDPSGVDVDSDGNVYVADKRNHRIQQFDARGEFLTQWGNFDTTGSSDPEFERFLILKDLAVDAYRNVYVLDNKTNTIQKFDSTGHFLIKWGGPSDDSNPENGKFNKPVGVAVDADGMVYVTDMDNHRVQKFTSDGEFVLTWGIQGSGDGEFNQPHGITVDFHGLVYVADRNNNRIQIFEPDGTFIKRFGFDPVLIYPVAVAVDRHGFIYVLDCGHRVLKFSADGECITQWGKDDGSDTTGSGDGEFEYPSDIALDSQGNIYVVDSGNHRIQKFTSNGRFITKWGSNNGDGTMGSGDGEFHNPYGIAVDSEGSVYISDTDNLRIQVFRILS
jgi:DNA-binding beta-propeller fold protein YncE